ncbi:MAG TPA: biotin--[acetyl-CoA-carboxylase] ligase [Thermoanaerobaculia bacterium]|nr:biotin--[acetyl-CoA-carboxylase] ligase [Thermoanaerobaculia bacterium]
MSFLDFAGELRRWSREAAVPVVVLRRVDSTNVLSRVVTRRLAGQRTGPRRALYVAWEQTAGRGRLGRSWVSSPGLGVYATLVLAPVPVAPPVAMLPLVAGIGFCRALRARLPAVGLKWPNDLVVVGRKIGGILIETLPMENGGQAALIGFGVNYGHERSELPTALATSVCVEGAAPDRGGRGLAKLVGTLSTGLLDALGELEEPSRVLDAYRELVVHRPGDTLRCRIQERSIEGHFVDFDGHGRLRVRCGDETVVVAAGDVLEGERTLADVEAAG